MKIEIDLAELFRDEDGHPTETTEEAIRRQIVERLTGDMRQRLFERVDRQLAAALDTMVSETIATQMPALIDDIMNTTYTPVSTYGQRGEPTTFRAEIIKAIRANLKYEPRTYSSEENAFTKAIKSIVNQQLAEVQKAIVAQVDTKFREDAVRFAVTELSKRLGLPKERANG